MPPDLPPEGFIPPRPGYGGKAALLGGLFARDGRSMLNLLTERAYSVRMGVGRIASKALFLVNAPETVREVMVDRVAAFPKHHYLAEILQPLIGISLFNANGAAWQQQRRLVDQAFAQAGLRRAFPLIAGGGERPPRAPARARSQPAVGCRSGDVPCHRRHHLPHHPVDAAGRGAGPCDLHIVSRLPGERPADHGPERAAPADLAAPRALPAPGGPPIAFYLREAGAADCLRGKPVAGGDMVAVSPWLVHRHHDFWERPDEFDPQRFNTECGRASARASYLPFGLGPRACPGAAFATQESVLIMAQVVRRFRIEPMPGHVPRPTARLTLRSANGVLLRLVPREPGP